MEHDLIFHFVKPSELKLRTENGVYSPESLEREGFIHCSTGAQINETANRLYKNDENILLLIIDTKRVESDIKFEKDEELNQKFPHIYGSLNTIAILDKIPLSKKEGEKLEIDFFSD